VNCMPRPTRMWSKERALHVRQCAIAALRQPVNYLGLRETLTNDSEYKKYWGNELHPSARGFDLVTAKFANLSSTL